MIFDDEYLMRQALIQARNALDKDEVPVGAIIVFNNKIISHTHNLTETLNDTSAHAEMMAITSASNYLGGKYLTDCSIYVTLEPCVMCAGALFWSQISRIVYGAKDYKRGYSRLSQNILHPKTKVTAGILEEECSNLILEFFNKIRKN